MTLRSRFIIIASGIIIFLIVAPLALFFAQGYYFDFHSRRIIKTGTLVVKTDPKNVSILLNGQEAGKNTPLVKRFLVPGEYSLQISKPGYSPWKKQITIHPQMVTSEPAVADKLVLFFEKPEATVLATTTANFFQNDSGAFYLSKNRLYQVTAASQPLLQNPSVPFANPAIIDAIQKSGNNFDFLIQQDNNQYADWNNSQFSPLPAQTERPSFDHETGKIYLLLKDGSLWNTANLQPASEIAKNVVTYTAASDIFYVTKTSDTPAKYQLWQQQKGRSPSLMLDNLPSFTKGQIIITSNKQIFLFLDNALYQVAETTLLLNSRVSYAAFDKNLNGIIYGNAHEVWIYLIAAGDSTLVTRSSQTLLGPVYNRTINYLFLAEANQIKTMEINDSGQPNIYTLAEAKTSNPVFTVSQNGDQLFYRDGSDLIELKIR